MIVKNIMKKDVITIPHTATYYEVAKILHDRQISGAPIVDDDNKLIGMITEKDLFKVLYPFYKSYYENPELYGDAEARESKASEIKDDKIEKFFSREIVTVSPDTLIMKAGALLVAKGIHRMPVVDEKGKIVGIISRGDIFGEVLKRNFNI
ncbi:MAG: CBS domain-containing protein [Candidatus Parcubacteria bacterium]|nr:CBS domain-containing protein [Candidatus Parcubacteria bacterium]